MKIDVQISPEEAAKAAAKFIAAEAQAAVTMRGRFVLGVSGGRVPWIMFRALAEESLPWNSVHLVQVDERVAPEGDTNRNLTHLEASLLAHVPLPLSQIHAMPVEENDLEKATESYARLLQEVIGSPPVLDLVHLGLGPDGHTASLVPGDPVVNISDRDVALTGYYQNYKRMTLTYPALNRARRILWLITGEDKQEMFNRLYQNDASIPAGRIPQAAAMVIADSAAVGSTHVSKQTK
jgi:6-phosphogluconolactonase